MKNTIIGFALLFQILISISVNAQCNGYAGEDIVECGKTISLNGNLDSQYTSGSWSTISPNLNIVDVDNPSSEVIFVSAFTESQDYACQLIWNLTDINTETCNDTLNLIFKALPSNNFYLESAICSGDFVDLIYLNENDAELPCPFLSDWNFDSNIILEATSDPCSLRVTAINTESEILVCPISLELEYNGCVSDFIEKELDVFSQGNIECCEEPTADAGEDEFFCGYTQTLDAQLSNPNHHGQWIFVGGPSVSFQNEEDWGSEFSPGNPNAVITVDGPGLLNMFWKEWDGECHDQDNVEFMFYHEAYCVGLHFNTYIHLPSSEVAQDGSISISDVMGESPFEYYWSNIENLDLPAYYQHDLGVGLYSVLVKGFDNAQSLRHIYLVPEFDNVLLENPLNAYDATVESELEFENYQAEIYDLLVLDDEILVQWKVYQSNSDLYFIDVSYLNEYTVSGAYEFVLNLQGENGESKTFQSIKYLDFDIMTGIGNREDFKGKIYPNPTNGFVYINSKGISELVLTDVSGRVISIQNESQANFEIDLSNEKPGIYLLHLKTKEGQQVVKLIRE